MFLWRHDSNLTYHEGQGDLLVTKCFKVSQTLQARCVFDQFLLESTTCTMKCKRISSLKCLTLQDKLTRMIGHVHQHTHVFLGTPIRTHISCEPKTEIPRPHLSFSTHAERVDIVVTPRPKATVFATVHRFFGVDVVINVACGQTPCGRCPHDPERNR